MQSGFDIKAFVLFIYATGLRPGEVRHLEWDDIDLQTRKLRLKTKKNCPTRYGLGWKPKWSKEREVDLNDMAMMILKRLPRLKSVGYIKGHSNPYPANFVFVTKDDARSSKGQVSWKRIDDVRYSWRKLLYAAKLWTPDNEKLLLGECPFHRHDVRRSWSAHAKESGAFSVEEASKVLGHDPLVNAQHYAAQIRDNRLQVKMNQHPSNSLSACYNLVTDTMQDGNLEKEGETKIRSIV
jgi:integrase